jgi:hypothetical protein
VTSSPRGMFAAMVRWFRDNRWLALGGALVVAAGLLVYWRPALGAAGATRPGGPGVFAAADGFASLAGFTFIAAALERVAEFLLAPWWAKINTKGVTTAGDRPTRVGVSGAAALRTVARSAHAQVATAGPVDSPAETKAKDAVDAADDVYVQATRARPTIMLPMAAMAALLCSYMHLFLLHSLARSGLPDTRLAFTADGLLTGFAIAGGAQPFHDLVSNLTASATAKKVAAGAQPPASTTS